MRLLTSRAHWFGPLLFLTILIVPTSLEPVQQKFLAIFAMVMAYWLFTQLPLAIPGLVGVALTVIMGISTVEKALTPMSSSIIYLFFGGFLIAKAMGNQQLDKRISLQLLSSNVVKGSFSRMAMAIVGLTGFFSIWVSNTATTAMMLPIVLGTLTSLQIKDKRLATLLLLACTYASSVGGIGSPVGSTPNIIGIGMLRSMANVEVSFFTWMAIAMPIMIFLQTIMYFYIRFCIPAELQKFDDSFLKLELKKLPAFSHRDTLVIGIFLLTVVGWFAPSLFQAVLAPESALVQFSKTRLDPGIVAIFCSSFLFFFPFNSPDKLLKYDDISGIDWNSLLLFGCGLSLGQGLFDTGLAKMAADFILSGMHGAPVIVLFFVVIYFIIFATELVSNTAAANILLPIIIALTKELNYPPTLIVLGACFACSMAFMLPVGTPPNAIVYGTGQVALKDMMKYGLWMNIAFGFLLSIYCYGLSLVL